MLESAEWTFAVITDIHMGYGYTDYGTLSWNDAGGQDYQLTNRLGSIVAWINEHKESNNIQFVAVLGDMSDSGEKSELLKARDILNGLNIPYIPVIGNHDIWPYTQQATTPFWRDWRTTNYPFTIDPGFAATAIGDQYFDEVFWQQNSVNVQKIQNLFGSSFKRQTDPVEYRYIQNSVFTYKGVKFVVADFVDRNPANHPQSDSARLNSDTERWLRENLVKDEPTVLLSHHAILPTLSGWIDSRWRDVLDIIHKSGCNFLANFAGHNHANRQALWLWPPACAVTTEAVCRESISWDPGVFVTREKKPIRLVDMTRDGQMKSYRSQPIINDNDMQFPLPRCCFRVACPVDLNVTDPDGFTITKEIGAVAGMYYFENYWNVNGEPIDLVLCDNLKSGNYQIKVIPELGALPNDTYTLGVFGTDAATILAENVSISNTPAEPYVINSTAIALNVPPTTRIEIGQPQVVNGTTSVISATPIDFPATDNAYGSGLASTTYRVYNSTFDTGWTTYINSVYLTGLSDGTYQIDYFSTDYLNNTEPTNTATVILDNTLLDHNVCIIRITSSKTVIASGFCDNITVYGADEGKYSETFNVTFYINTTQVKSQNVTLTSGNSTTVTFTWNTTGFAYGNYTLSAYAWPVQGETDTADNNFTGGWVIVSLVGDITGPNSWPDGKCDIRDLSYVAKRFGTTPSSPMWDPNADVTGPTPGIPDGKIDIRDISLVARHFGDHT